MASTAEVARWVVSVAEPGVTDRAAGYAGPLACGRAVLHHSLQLPT